MPRKHSSAARARERGNAQVRESVKTTLSLPSEAMAALRARAAERNTTFAEVVRRALSVDKFLADSTKAGCRILVEDPDKSVKELVLF